MTERAFIETFLRENLDYIRDKYRARAEVTVASKRDAHDLLTEVDLTLQKRAVDLIRQTFPGDGIVAEEGEFARDPADPDGRCWVMDPVDGTNNFVRGLFPVFGVSLAFAMGGVPVVGGILLPGMGDLLLAERGRGAYQNGERITVSDFKTVPDARVELDFSNRGERPDMVRRCGHVLLEAGQLRCNGAAVASLCHVAAGEAEAYVNLGLSAWDYAAGQVLVEEAGGMATRLDGAPLRLFDGGQGALFSNGAIHQELVNLVHA